MSNKFDKYLNCECCKILDKLGYNQVFKNIIMDDERFITEEMKMEFFEHMKEYDGISDVMQYCDSFFNKPSRAPLANKKYLFKGERVDNRIYNIELGRVAKKMSISLSVKNALDKQLLFASNSNLSDIDNEDALNYLLIDIQDKESITDNRFKDFINEFGIGKQILQDNPMWTFEGLDNDDVFYGIDLVDLPCLLGLPGVKRTHEQYDKIPRVAFSLKVSFEVLVYKPTSFDAGLTTVWRHGGKTKCHVECEGKYGVTGMEEYVHEPVSFDSITSNIYQI